MASSRVADVLNVSHTILESLQTVTDAMPFPLVKTIVGTALRIVIIAEVRRLPQPNAPTLTTLSRV